MARAATVRVKRGARWLDENFAGWEKRINVDTLDLGDENKCICGQVFKKKAKKEGKEDGYDYATDTLFTEANKWINGIVKMETKSQGLPEDDWYERAQKVARALGFQDGRVHHSLEESSDNEYVSFDDLQNAWVKLLAKRAAPVDN